LGTHPASQSDRVDDEIIDASSRADDDGASDQLDGHVFPREEASDPQEDTSDRGEELISPQELGSNPASQPDQVADEPDEPEGTDDQDDEPEQPRVAGSGTQRTLRSHGKALSWNPSMGDKDVIIERTDGADDASSRADDNGASDLSNEQVLPRDEASNPEEETSDPGEELTNQVAGRSEDSTTTTRELRSSGRRSQPPSRLTYSELGSSVANNLVPAQETAAGAHHVNASTVHASREEQDDEQGWWNWVRDAIEDLSIRLH